MATVDASDRLRAVTNAALGAVLRSRGGSAVPVGRPAIAGTRPSWGVTRAIAEKPIFLAMSGYLARLHLLLVGRGPGRLDPPR